ncbi:unnamed protein product [Leptosia nina]|uniref:TIL domain-containing protein n=1 Tax=Leptosia nina TaxID=320188 RepID=A0AAV1K1L7_9NEOP
MRKLLLWALLLYDVTDANRNYDYDDIDSLKRHSFIDDRRNWRKKALLKFDQDHNWEERRRYEDTRYLDDIENKPGQRKSDYDSSGTGYGSQKHDDEKTRYRSTEISHSATDKETDRKVPFSMNCERPHERYEPCFSGCAAISCDNPRERLRPCYPFCEPGCICTQPYVRDDRTHKCVLPDDCTNAKLRQNYRRQYEEPTRAEEHLVTLDGTEPPAPFDPIDHEVNEITKNADDLGDWLYNQFFKTIENQVINKTQENEVPTRRNGVPIKAMDLRRSRKKNKKSKQKRRKSSMRRKLLRITENDSVFDSSQEHASSETSESSSDESDGTFEIAETKEKHKDDKEHGHKKIVIINKKPKPPLPSFIFLPNMDTPFYPPIGLPPPPIMPMYPIIPVPPMPVYPCPEQGASETTVVLTTTTKVTPTSTTSPKGTTQSAKTPEISEVEDPFPTTIDSGTTTQKPTMQPGRSGSYKKRNRASRMKQNGYSRRPHVGLKTKPSQDERQKLFQHLRERMNKPAPLRPPKGMPNDNEDEMFESPLTEDNMFDDTFNNEIPPKPKHGTGTQQPDNVDFKYISELIHRVNLNNTNELPPIEYNPRDSAEFYKPRKPYYIKNRKFNAPIETRRLYSDDSYYTNLGRQIASIIRNADAQNQQVDIEIEQSERNNEDHILLNNNSPRSFWERSVRSPLKYLNSNKNKYDYLKKSNELLFNIENKVSIVASTMPSLTLQEIENIVNVMEKAQSKIKNKHVRISQDKSDDNLNFNLWPQETGATRNDFNKIIVKPAPKTIVQKGDSSNSKNLPEIKGLSMHNIQRVTAWLSTNRNNRTYKADFGSNMKLNSNDDRGNPVPKPHVQSIAKDNRLNASQYPKSKYHDYYQPSYQRKGMNKYFQDGQTAREFDGLNFPMKPMRHSLSKPMDQQPSYFHHEINHFDYFN